MPDTERSLFARPLDGGVRSPFAGLRIAPELVCEFFAVFSRFEFALKEHGYLIAGRSRAEPDWRRFAREVGPGLKVEPASALEAAIAYLNQEPPLVQMRQKGWKSKPLHGDSSVARAIDAACRVRHNLFHGGKHTPHSPPGRDQKLVECALAVLLACVLQDEGFRGTFEHTDF